MGIIRVRDQDTSLKKICEKQGVTLIEVPYHFSESRVQELLSKYYTDV